MEVSETEKKITVRLPISLYNKLEEIMKEEGYKSEAEAIRGLIREKARELKKR
ncbi:hypothetical protein J4526_01520 [Desulfurococcaceae archaeon MEX13E-LK6-19]|nr:hypothetical protein J4526_01520 [Desulfurococcaceae archaeon MEX13E-LK6-19]